MKPAARVAASAGAAAWLGALAGWGIRWWAAVLVVPVLAGVVAAAARRRLPAFVVAVVVVAAGACVSGALAAGRQAATLEAAVPAGRAHVIGVVADEPLRVGDEVWVVLRSARTIDSHLALPPIGVLWGDGPTPGPGDLVLVWGRLAGRSGSVRGDPVAGRLTARQVSIVARAPGPFHRIARAMRARVDTVVRNGAPDDVASELLVGFLIGDTSGLDDRSLEHLRGSGLSHYVAVSGSNVALFLAAWWLVLAPLAGPRVRAAIGLVGVALFVVVTRWEPSVLRASAMLGLVLAGRIAGIPIDPAVAFGWGVAGLMLVAGDLAATVGFQLSAAATIGVMLGARWAAGRRPRWMWSVLAATGGAQLAVAPLALIHFGSVPLMAPIANLLAAPLVTIATGLGGAAVLVGGGPVLVPARLAASAVLFVSELAAGWPQLDVGGVVAVVSVASLWRLRSLRPVVVAALAAGVVLAMLPAGAYPGATVTALDVGQGDAVLIRDEDGVMLVDGGRDPTILADALDRNGVDRIDIVVVTHGDADHSGGLVGLVATMPVREVWVPAYGDLGVLVEEIVDEAQRAGAVVREVAAGSGARVGRLHVTTVGPLRRYKGDNDGAIVLWIDGGTITVLLPSDVEALAQRELPDLRPQVMLVPHHGSSTTDPRWLRDTVGRLAIISVGENPYGHPDPSIVDVLVQVGAEVLTTMHSGDIVVPLLP